MKLEKRISEDFGIIIIASVLGALVATFLYKPVSEVIFFSALLKAFFIAFVSLVAILLFYTILKICMGAISYATETFSDPLNKLVDKIWSYKVAKKGKTPKKRSLILKLKREWKPFAQSVIAIVVFGLCLYWYIGKLDSVWPYVALYSILLALLLAVVAYHAYKTIRYVKKYKEIRRKFKTRA